MNLIPLVKIEIIKIKRTLLFYLCVGMPLLIVILMFSIFLYYKGAIMLHADSGRWLFLAKLVQTYWGLFLLPLFVTLQTALLAGLEHRGNVWTMLYAQPVRKLDILCAKYAVGFLVIAISQVLVFLLTIIMGLILRRLVPVLDLESSIPVLELLILHLTVYGLSILMIAIQIWVSLHWSNFVTTVSLGIGATVSGVIVFGSDFVYYYPWALPGVIANHFNLEAFPWTNLAYCLGVGILVILFGMLDLLGRENY